MDDHYRQTGSKGSDMSGVLGCSMAVVLHFCTCLDARGQGKQKDANEFHFKSMQAASTSSVQHRSEQVKLFARQKKQRKRKGSKGSKQGRMACSTALKVRHTKQLARTCSSPLVPCSSPIQVHKHAQPRKTGTITTLGRVAAACTTAPSTPDPPPAGACWPVDI